MYKRYFKLFIVIFVLALIVGNGITSSYALDAESNRMGEIVNCKRCVNVRSGPGTSYSIIGTGTKGTDYEVTANSRSWYKIEYNGSAGYVYNKFLLVSSSQEEQTGKIIN